MDETLTLHCDRCQRSAAVVSQTYVAKRSDFSVRCATLACGHRIHVAIRTFRLVPRPLSRTSATSCTCADYVFAQRDSEVTY